MKAALAAILLASAAFSTAAVAQDFPNGPITIIVPFSAGGSTDSAARFYGNALSETLGVPVVIENRTGAAGTIAGDYLAKATPDGQTLIFTISGPLNYAQYIFPELSYDVPGDFAPVAGVAQTINVIVKHPDFEPNDIDELIAYAAEHPRSVRFGTPGVGSGGHITAEALNYYADVEFLHVPYQGAAPAVNDLIAGRVEIVEATLGTMVPHLEAGTMEILTFAEPEPVPGYEDYSIVETAVPGVSRAKWFGIFAPAGTPEDVLDTLEAATEEIATGEAFMERIATLGELPMYRNREAFTALVNEDVEEYGRIIDEAGLTFQ